MSALKVDPVAHVVQELDRGHDPTLGSCLGAHFDLYHHHHEEERPQAQLESCRRVCRKEVGETTFPTRCTFSQQSTLCNSDFQMLVFGCSAGPRLIHTQFKISDLGDFDN